MRYPMLCFIFAIVGSAFSQEISDSLHATPSVSNAFDTSSVDTVPKDSSAIPSDSTTVATPDTTALPSPPKTFRGTDVIVRGKRIRKEVSRRELTREQTQKVAASLSDPVRTLSTLPGVTVSNDVSIRPQVRGGKNEETRVFLDGVPLIQPYHVLSMFSVFHQESIRDLKLYTGGLPADYANALSGILAVSTRTPPLDTAFGGLSLNMMRGSAWAGIPVPKYNLGLWLSAQSFWYDFFVRRIADIAHAAGSMNQKDYNQLKQRMELPTFRDLQGGLLWKLSPPEFLS